MERKIKVKVKAGIPMDNITSIAIAGIVITHQEPSALFLSDKHEYTCVKTGDFTYSIYPYPLDN